MWSGFGTGSGRSLAIGCSSASWCSETSSSTTVATKVLVREAIRNWSSGRIARAAGMSAKPAAIRDACPSRLVTAVTPGTPSTSTRFWIAARSRGSPDGPPIAPAGDEGATPISAATTRATQHLDHMSILHCATACLLPDMALWSDLTGDFALRQAQTREIILYRTHCPDCSSKEGGDNREAAEGRSSFPTHLSPGGWRLH